MQDLLLENSSLLGLADKFSAKRIGRMDIEKQLGCVLYGGREHCLLMTDILQSH